MIAEPKLRIDRCGRELIHQQNHPLFEGLQSRFHPPRTLPQILNVHTHTFFPRLDVIHRPLLRRQVFRRGLDSDPSQSGGDRGHPGPIEACYQVGFRGGVLEEEGRFGRPAIV